MDEYRSGKRESSQMSALSTDSLSRDDKEAWRQLRKELESIGITPDIFNRNRHFILSTLQNLSQDNYESNYPYLATINEEGFSQDIPYAACTFPPGAGTHDDMTLLPEFENMTLPIREPLPTPDEAIPKDPSNEGIYKGFTFFKADLPPGMSPTWRRVERTELHFTQRELYKMVRKRAHRYSAAQQYQHLCNLRQAHVNQLIDEHRRNDPSVEWSCVYVKERDRHVHGSHDDGTTISMDVILMRRKLTTIYPRTPMGDIVDLSWPFQSPSLFPDTVSPSTTLLSPDYPNEQVLIPGQVIAPGYVVQGPLTRERSYESLEFLHDHAVESGLALGDKHSFKRSRSI